MAEIKTFGYLEYDVVAGQGRIRLVDDFYENDPVIKLDIAMDWRSDAEDIYLWLLRSGING